MVIRAGVTFPKNLQDEYQATLLDRVATLEAVLMAKLGPLLKRQAKSDAVDPPDPLQFERPSRRVDATPIGPFISVVEAVRVAFGGQPPSAAPLLDIAAGVDRRQVRELRRVTGISVPGGDTPDAVFVRWSAKNVSLIKTIDARYFSEIEKAIRETLGKGRPTSELVARIRQRTGVAESRARLIARDQLGKLNADISESRQTALGVTEYIWQTSEDERVRPEHEERNGQTFKWSTPPEDGHPGQPIQCRCVALPVLPD